MKPAAEIRIGTSGWHYKHWVGRFYPEHSSSARMLSHYVQHFDTVELNNSFYKLPDVSTFSSWRAAVPGDFRFAVKASRYITHNKKLKDPENALENLLPRAETLGRKLGPVLFQLHPHWKLNLARLEEFLRALPKRRRYTFEFRDPTWNTGEVYELLRHYNAAHCIYELGGFVSPEEVTADWVYVRLHGPAGKYQGCYSGDTLNDWSARIVGWSSHLEAIYVYFDNDESAYSVYNALELKRMVEAEFERRKLAR